jgi:hypothetical protein
MHAKTPSAYRRLEPARMALPESPAYTEVLGSGSSQLASTPQARYPFASSHDPPNSRPDPGWSTEPSELTADII